MMPPLYSYEKHLVTVSDEQKEHFLAKFLQPHRQHHPEKPWSAVPPSGQTGGSRDTGGVRHQDTQTGTTHTLQQSSPVKLLLLD